MLDARHRCAFWTRRQCRRSIRSGRAGRALRRQREHRSHIPGRSLLQILCSSRTIGGGWRRCHLGIASIVHRIALVDPWLWLGSGTTSSGLFDRRQIHLVAAEVAGEIAVASILTDRAEICETVKAVLLHDLALRRVAVLTSETFPRFRSILNHRAIETENTAHLFIEHIHAWCLGRVCRPVSEDSVVRRNSRVVPLRARVPVFTVTPQNSRSHHRALTKTSFAPKARADYRRPQRWLLWFGHLSVGGCHQELEKTRRFRHGQLSVFHADETWLHRSTVLTGPAVQGMRRDVVKGTTRSSCLIALTCLPVLPEES